MHSEAFDYNQKVVVHIPLDNYIEFCQLFGDKISEALLLDIFKKKEVCEYAELLSANIFSNEIKEIKSLIDDEHCAIACIDIPECTKLTNEQNIVFGAAVVIGVFKNLGVPNIDSMDGMPFTLHQASHTNQIKLNNAGFQDFLPDAKLGFHNDGLVAEENISLPKHIVIYNMYIAYNQPGKFSWVPTGLWEDAEKFKKIAKANDTTARIKLTPNLHLNDEQEFVHRGAASVAVPLIATIDSGEFRFFLNGNVLAAENTPEIADLFQSMRSSISNNSQRISIDQKERRSIFLKNTAGFHARDIFESPMEGVDLTRVFIRLVDINAEKYPGSLNKGNAVKA